ncbi:MULTISPECIES: M20/M25/M40 family metallo-hydrolase [unclassified Polaribacter]|uniref:M20/M25/M40 family metallo-hydrolase n=1 Tax=unclassified Polaribacter TaxID=196858 RepID=UPI0011BF5C34|nr:MULTISPECIES: M20/M25/M40 family metallo-hydrolase [unclassified Polaribacter]TXD54369.1 M20/M25/M40 family metallo-hydrolase [Polaribacter sp. IC063]TXD62800.1 M20/M25/M40 family metallo-hydrolase [Polaribacter sp. IC066]
MKNIVAILVFMLSLNFANAQENWDAKINSKLPEVLVSHRAFVSIPNLPADIPKMYENIDWVKNRFQKVHFQLKALESPTLPVLFAERIVDPTFKTVLFYFHLDGQAVNAAMWNQKNPFIPALKEQKLDGTWEAIPWSNLEEEINDDWRIFGRAAADDKAPIVMFLSALELLQQQNLHPKFNIKIIFDLEEEYSSEGFLSTLKKYKEIYESDYMIIMDGPAHNSNQPTLTFGCRGIATCSITTYGSKLPQHSGHFGNYVANPVFTLSRLLASMKSEGGKVRVKDYYKGIVLPKNVSAILNAVPDNTEDINNALLIHKAENVGNNYQEALQYPTLNIRQIGTSWKGEGLKTIIPEYATADIDVRLVVETDGQKQLDKIKNHITEQGFLVLNRAPTDTERLENSKIVTFKGNAGVHAFRTPLNSFFGEKIRSSLTASFGEIPISIRTMGGTVPIVPAITELDIPAIIVPMVNMDNNQHNPNENIRIGNIRQGIKICLAILNTSL